MQKLVLLLALAVFLAGCSAPSEPAPPGTPPSLPTDSGAEETAHTTIPQPDICGTVKTSTGELIYAAEDAAALLGGDDWVEELSAGSSFCWIHLGRERTFAPTEIRVETKSAPEFETDLQYIRSQQTIEGYEIHGKEVSGVGDAAYFAWFGDLSMYGEVSNARLNVKIGERYSAIACREEHVACAEEEYVSIAETILGRV